jgi:hypothetical protein
MTPEKELSSTSKLYTLSKKTSKREKEAREKEKNSMIGQFIELGTLEPDLPSPPNLYKPPTFRAESEEEKRKNAKIRKEAEEGLARQLRGLNQKKKIHSPPKDHHTPSRKPDNKNPFSYRIKFQKCQSEKKALTDEIEELKTITESQNLRRASSIEDVEYDEGIDHSYIDDDGGKTKKKKKRRSKQSLKKRTTIKRKKRKKRKKRTKKKKISRYIDT